MLLRLPTPILGRVMRWEWFVEEGAAPTTGGLLDDVLQPAHRPHRATS
ncbi:hypothetical protein OHB12_17760 [Nocardia sp. NBC_01730]|nr:hypothetical protein OHB12_17760 [Nocardia sp. NBC_01730]